MKIVHVETGRHFYGGAQQVMWLIEGLATRGIDNLLVCPPDSGIDRAARKAAIPVRNLACNGDLDFRFAWRLRKLARREKPDVVHCHSRRGADFLGGQALALSGVPAVLSRRVDHAEPGLLARWRYRPFRKIVAISQNIATVLEEGGMRPERVTVIRSGVDAEGINTTPDCEAFREKFVIDDGDLVIAVVAQLIPRKGVPYAESIAQPLR